MEQEERITTKTKSTETIVFGKLEIISDSELINTKIVIHFNERLWAKNAVWLDDNGYFYMKMPIGANFIALIEYRQEGIYYKNIPDNYLSINVPSADKIYYIGDINIDWTPTQADQRGKDAIAMGGAIGGLAQAILESKKEGEMLPTVINESQTTIDYFKQKFPDNTKEIVTSIMYLGK